MEIIHYGLIIHHGIVRFIQDYLINLTLYISLIKNGDLLDMCVSMDEVCYVLQLEIIECSRAQHSKKRDVPDEIREQDIRKMLKTLNIPMGLLYVTVAHTKHVAHLTMYFFTKPKDEYEVIPDRLLAFFRKD